MGNKQLKNRTPINSAIKIELNNKLVELAKETRIPKSKLWDEAVELLLNKYERSDNNFKNSNLL